MSMMQKLSLDGIEKSEVYLALVTDGFVNDAACLAQWEHARTLGKPFMILQERGVCIPLDMLEGVQLVVRSFFDHGGSMEGPMRPILDALQNRACSVCGCTNADCRQCIEAQGGPCHWVAWNLCSRCAHTPVAVPGEQPSTKSATP